VQLLWPIRLEKLPQSLWLCKISGYFFSIFLPGNKLDAEHEIDVFINNWKLLASQQKGLRYYVLKTDKYNRLMNTYGEACDDTEKIL